MIGFIGAGHVGITLGMYFKNHSINISGYFSRTYASAQKGADYTKSHPYRNLIDIVKDSDILFVTTSDDSIESVASNLATLDINWSNKLVCHTSGVHPSSLFDTLSQKGASIASLHPMLSFSNIERAIDLLKQTPLTLEGKGSLIDTLKTMLKHCNMTVYEIKTEQKALYHSAACMVSNYLVTLMDIGIDSLVTSGFEKDKALALIKPLVLGTINNYFKLEHHALTGPLSRGDVNTISKHLEAISKEDSLIEDIYRLLGMRTLKICKQQNNLDEYTLNHLKEVLHDEKNNYRNNKEEEKQ